jgi:hypothetical protein
MPTFDYDGKVFRGIENYHDGDLNSETRFFYHQDGDLVWGETKGGAVAAGSFLAVSRSDGSLEMSWHYVNLNGELIRGSCRSTPEPLPDGRLRLHEDWQIDGGEAGRSIIEEVAEV